MWLGLLSGAYKLQAPLVSQETLFGGDLSLSLAVALYVCFLLSLLKLSVLARVISSLQFKRQHWPVSGKGGHGTVVYVWHKPKAPHVFKGQQFPIC